MWNDPQLQTYHEQGFARCPGLLSQEEITALKTTSDEYISRYKGDGPLVIDDDPRVHMVKEHNGYWQHDGVDDRS